MCPWQDSSDNARTSAPAAFAQNQVEEAEH
jgi:hypothetical protein